MSKSKSSIVLFQCIMLLVYLSFITKVCLAVTSLDYESINIPIFQGYYAKTLSNKPKIHTKTIIYKLKTDIPPNNIFSFYDVFFSSIGWTLTSSNKALKWFSFVDITKEGRPRVKQATSFWSNNEQEAEAMLVIRYETAITNAKELIVICQLQPKLDKIRIKAFLNKLQESGKFSDFFDLVNTYRDEDNVLLIDKAIKENTKSEFIDELKELKTLMVHGVF